MVNKLNCLALYNMPFSSVTVVLSSTIVEYVSVAPSTESDMLHIHVDVS